MKTNTKIAVLEKEFSENNNSHVFLVETNDQESALKNVKNLIKKILDDENVSIQVENETYLELIIVRPEGKDIKKDSIHVLQDRVKTKPILSDHIFYVIAEAEKLNPIAANKLLKTIEEPNDNVIGFLLTSNADLILPTIKSRCEQLTLIYDVSNDLTVPDDLHDKVKKLIESIENRDHVEFSKIKSDENILKENFKIVEKLLKNYYNTACNLTKEKGLDKNLLEKLTKNNAYSQLIRKSHYLNKTFNKLSENMNKDLLLEKVFIELKDVK